MGFFTNALDFAEQNRHFSQIMLSTWIKLLRKEKCHAELGSASALFGTEIQKHSTTASFRLEKFVKITIRLPCHS